MTAKLSLVIYLDGGVFTMSVNGSNITTNISNGHVGLLGGNNQYRIESVLSGISSQLDVSTGLLQNVSDFAILDPNDPNNTQICMSSDQISQGQCMITRTSPTVSVFYIKSEIDENYLYVDNNNNIMAYQSQSKPLSNITSYWFYIENTNPNTYTIKSAKTGNYIGMSIGNNYLTTNDPKSIFTFTTLQNPTAQSVIDNFNAKFSSNNFNVCCNQIQPLSYTDDFAACSYSGYYFDTATELYSNNCKNYMMYNCSTNGLNNYLCEEFCNNSDTSINCDNITQIYCNGLGQAATSTDVCNCFWPAEYLDNYYNSLQDTFPQYTFTRNPMCDHVLCSQLDSDAINRYSYKQNKTCPNIELCVNKITFSNDGTIQTNAINFNEVMNCFGSAPSSSSPSSSSSNSGSAPSSSGSPSSSSPSNSIFSSSAVKITIIVIILFMFFFMGVIVILFVM